MNELMKLTQEEVSEIVGAYESKKRKYLPHYHVPDYTVEAIDRYMHLRVKPGAFLSAVFNNDLFVAVQAADQENSFALTSIVGFIYNAIPIIARDMNVWTNLVIKDNSPPVGEGDSNTEGQSS